MVVGPLKTPPPQSMSRLRRNQFGSERLTAAWLGHNENGRRVADP